MSKEELDFDKGREAYYNSDDERYFGGSPDFKAGYRDAFCEANPKYDDEGNGSDAAFEAHINQIDSERITDSDLSGVFVATMVPVGVIVGILASMALVILVRSI